VILDISPLIGPEYPVWPQDVVPAQEWSCRRAAGDSTNTSAIRTTVHLAAHADAPFHWSDDGADIAGCALEAYIGPVLLLDVSGLFGAHRRGDEPLISPWDVEEAVCLAGGDAARLPARVLFRTGTWSPAPPFREDFAALAPETIDWLADRGVCLVGLDTPSVDPFDSKTLDAHHRLGARGVRNLECLSLDGVPPGDYELIALPLRLAGFDASPVRAILRSAS
jgi:arylformamidase